MLRTLVDRAKTGRHTATISPDGDVLSMPNKTAPAKAARLLGQRYRLDEPIARGGMAVVWRATDLRLGRRVAVKVLHPRLANDENFRERFRREAVAAASFNHPNVITVFDTGEDDSSHYIVMELINGPSLSRLLGPTGRLNPQECVSLLRGALAALGYAHDHGVVHRDIKPANIMLSPDATSGSVKVGDFGIARAAAGSDLTATGAIIGTASYLAPEQARGESVDNRADLYSLGCVGYRCLAGRLPWIAETELAVAMARTMRPPDPLAPKCPEAPKKLVHVIEAVLAIDPASRYPTAEAMAAALASLRGTTIRHERRVPSSAPRAVVRSDTPPAEMSSDRVRVTPEPSTPEPRRSLLAARPGSVDAAGPKPKQGVAVRRQSETGRRRHRAQRSDRSRPIYSRRDRARSRARAAAHAKRMQRARRTALIAAITFAVLAILLIGFVSNRTDEASPSIREPREPIFVVAVSDYDPLGDGGDKADSTSYALDGDLETAWRTEGYKTREFGNLQSGVGLAFDLGSVVEPVRIDVAISTETDFSLYRTDQDPADLDGPDEWIEIPSADFKNVGASATNGQITKLRIDTGTEAARYWMIWISRLSPQVIQRTFYFTEIAEVSFGVA